MAPAASSLKDPSKMSKSELVRLYKAAVAEKDELSKKYGKVQKKYKHVKKTLNASQGTDGPAERTKIRKPAGAIHGRDGFNLADFIEEHSGVGKEIYNAFMTSIRQAMIAAGIPATATWDAVCAGPLSEVLDVVREQFPWLGDYEADWPATMLMKQNLRNKRSDSSRKVRGVSSRKVRVRKATTPGVAAAA